MQGCVYRQLHCNTAIARRHDTPFVIVMMSDALNRTFQDLRSKHEDARVKAAGEVHTAVVLAARGDLT